MLISLLVESRLEKGRSKYFLKSGLVSFWPDDGLAECPVNLADQNIVRNFAPFINNHFLTNFFLFDPILEQGEEVFLVPE